MSQIISRRHFLSFLAAPAIVHVGNLMPVKAWNTEEFDPLGVTGPNYATLVENTRRAFVPRAFVQLWIRESISLNGVPIYFDE
jgi:hypothetical protein